MRNSRARMLAPAAAVLLFAGIAAPGFAQTQSNAPVDLTRPLVNQDQSQTGNAPVSLGAPTATPRRLLPRQPQPEATQTPAQAAGVTGAATNLKGKAGISVDGLGKIDSESVGALTERDGGMGDLMWQGRTRAEAVELVKAIPRSMGSTTLRNVAERLLLSHARAPLATDDDAPSLLDARARALLEMGDLEAAQLLLATSPTQGRPRGLDFVDAHLQLLQFNNARACGLARNNQERAGVDFWQRLLIYCDALEGKADSVGFGLSLLRETSGDDPAMVLLADSILSGSPIVLEQIENPKPIHIAMSRVAKVTLPDDLAKSDDPVVLHGLALTPNASIGARIDAAERAVPMGALNPSELRRLYQQVKFEADDLGNALTRAAEIGGAAARALLYQAAAKQNIPTARAEIISNALGIAREDERYKATIHAFKPLIDRLPPSPEMVWFALTGVRAYLMLGDPVGTDRWLALLRASATVQDEARPALARVRPLARLIGAGDSSIPLQTVLDDWRATLEDGPQLNQLRALVNGMYLAIGTELPPTAWDGIVAGAPGSQIMPASKVWFQFRHSLRTVMANKSQASAPVMVGSAGISSVSSVALKAPNEIIPPGVATPLIYAMQVMGNGDFGAQGIAAVYDVIAALKALGLGGEARQLALETMLAAGM